MSLELLKKDLDMAKKKTEDSKKISTLKRSENSDPSKKKNDNKIKSQMNIQGQFKYQGLFNGWISRDRTNVEVKLYENFEYDILNQHKKVLQKNKRLLALPQDQDKTEIGKIFEIGMRLFLANRLLRTLPSSKRSEIPLHVLNIERAEIPKVPIVINEMYRHIGKLSHPSYGNIRIEGHLLHFRKQIGKAIESALTIKHIKRQLKSLPGKSIEFSGDDYWHNCLWNDRESYLLAQKIAARKLDIVMKTIFTINDVYVSPPYWNWLDKNNHTPEKVLEYWNMIKNYPEEAIDGLVYNLLILFIDFNFFEIRTSTLSEYYDGFDNWKFKDLNCEDIMRKLGLKRLDKSQDDDTLKKNYNILLEYYRRQSEPYVLEVFKTTDLAQKEFGTEALLVKSDNPDEYDDNPQISCQFVINDQISASAGGMFNYSEKMDFNISNFSVLGATRRNYYASLISDSLK